MIKRSYRGGIEWPKIVHLSLNRSGREVFSARARLGIDFCGRAKKKYGTPDYRPVVKLEERIKVEKKIERERERERERNVFGKSLKTFGGSGSLAQ